MVRTSSLLTFADRRTLGVPSGGASEFYPVYLWFFSMAHLRLLLSNALGMPLRPHVDGSDAMSSLSVYQITTQIKLPALCIRDILPEEVQAAHVSLIRF
jgi:hypothetical protein